MRTILFITVAALAFANAARADIYQWEYIDPSDPSQGKRQSTTLAPGGAGVDAMPGANFYGHDLTKAYLIGADLTNAYGVYANLTDADLCNANLTDAYFVESNLTGASLREADLTNADFSSYAYCGVEGCDSGYTTLTDADFTGADVRGTNFSAIRYAAFPGGLTLAQLYTTGSYQARDLTGIVMDGSDLAGANFAGQQLNHASFVGANLADANFTDADVRHTVLENSGFTSAQLYSTASYQAHDLTGVRLSGVLTGWELAGQDLTNARFYAATLSDADFTDADIQRASFAKALDQLPNTWLYLLSGSGITPAQLSSTKSYRAYDLSGIDFSFNVFVGGNFAKQDLTNASFYGATLSHVDFSNSQIRGADFARWTHPNLGIVVHGTSITLAQLYSTASYIDGDLRGVNGVDLSAATTRNVIMPDGHLSGLDLDALGLLVIRDYDGDPARTDPVLRTPTPIPTFPITVDEHLTMAVGSTLRIVLETDAWDSTISFAPGIPIALGGTLELTFADNVNLASQVGRTIGLFDWTGVSPTGAFAISSPYDWDLSQLYTTGEVKLVYIPEPSCVAVATVSPFALSLFRRRKKP